MNCVATVIGLDISKNVFVAVGRDDQGQEAFRKKFSRHQVLAFFAKATPAKVGIEACASAHHWARALAGQGHEVRLIAGQHVKAYLTGNKNDANDALWSGCYALTLHTTPCKLDHVWLISHSYVRRISRSCLPPQRHGNSCIEICDSNVCNLANPAPRQTLSMLRIAPRDAHRMTRRQLDVHHTRQCPSGSSCRKPRAGATIYWLKAQ